MITKKMFPPARVTFPAEVRQLDLELSRFRVPRVDVSLNGNPEEGLCRVPETTQTGPTKAGDLS